ncbi:MAG: hypothetical protein HY692_02645 [Cyanobacteria bacterium NC_groundwater_1444_Ag_S-0.65um_54_12]|nr:hypothetical protein [Cyanobacteria bacterium NC_groundwater_1444_Ag_S-0.65um_54_12]
MDFYQRVFTGLGFSGGRYWQDPYDKAQTVVFGNGHMYLELVEDPNSIPAEVSDISGPRIEFSAERPEEIDEFHKHLLLCGVDVISGPAKFFEDLFRAEGVDDVWYAVYFADPDGRKFGLIYSFPD